jgi:hypothetical protein
MVPDRARACPTCALRVRERACPECGAPTLDLRDRTTRRVVAQQLAAQPGTAPPEGVVGDVVAAYLRWGVPLLSLVGAGVLTYLHGVAAAFLGMLMVFFGQVVMVPLVAGGVAVVSHVALGRRGRPARALRIHDEREPTLDRYVELVGVVRALRPVSSPLSHAPCVAYRLVGETSSGAVDEAGAGELHLETDDGRAVRVDARRAQIRIAPPPAPYPVVRPDAALTRLLDERALSPSRGPVRLAERVLQDGARVRARGVLGSMRTEDGYRGHDDAPTLEAVALLDA